MSAQASLTLKLTVDTDLIHSAFGVLTTALDRVEPFSDLAVAIARVIEDERAFDIEVDPDVPAGEVRLRAVPSYELMGLLIKIGEAA